MKILFKRLRLLNFCGIREADYTFGGEVTIIRGRNGIGKSTLVNAVHYVLFGTDVKGNALDIKTFDANHNIIPEIEHAAELELSVDGEEYTLKRSLVDKWKGKECKNVYKYFVNGEVTTAGDFKKAIDGICPETTFRLASSPTYFVSLPWNEQRKFLEQLVPETIANEITKGDAKYDFVTEALKKESIDQLLHHIKYQRAEVQKELDCIPVRLKELDAAKPEAEDWEKLNEDLDEKKEAKKRVEEKIGCIIGGEGEQVRKEGIRKRIDFQRKRIAEMERGARNLFADEEAKHLSDVINARKGLSQAESMVDELKAKMRGYTETEVLLNKQIEQQKAEIKSAGEKYQKINAERWIWNADNGFCSHCGQPLQAEKVSHIKKESEERFNADKSARLKGLLEDADRIKKEHSDCKVMLEQMCKERTATTNQLTDAHKMFNEATLCLAKIDKETPRTYDDILAANDNYRQATGELEKLEAELNRPCEKNAEDEKMIAALQKDKSDIEGEINNLIERLAKKESFERIDNLIMKAREDKKTYQQQLDELDGKLDIATDYYQLSCSILEDKVNEQFQYVKWSLFKSNLDGEKKPFCECYKNGVPYSRLNSAAKVNAGIDIAYTISQYYGVDVPMLLDECESNIFPLYRGGQQIRLYVSHDDKLVFEYPERIE